MATTPISERFQSPQLAGQPGDDARLDRRIVEDRQRADEERSYQCLEFGRGGTQPLDERPDSLLNTCLSHLGLVGLELRLGRAQVLHHPQFRHVLGT